MPDALGVIFVDFLDAVGRDAPGDELIHADFVRRELVGEDFRECRHGRPHHRGKREIADGLSYSRRSAQQDGPAAAGGHRRNRQPDHAYGAQQQQFECALPGGIVELQHGTRRRATRIGVEQIDAAKTVDRLVVPVRERIRGTHVGGDGQDVGTRFRTDSVSRRRTQPRDFARTTRLSRLRGPGRAPPRIRARGWRRRPSRLCW